MNTINPYLTFDGNCEAAFAFYKSIFGGEYQTISKFKDMPPMPGMELPDSAKERIMHVSLPISKETILMGSDSNPAMGKVPFGKQISLSVNTESKAEADRIFNALAAGGQITMPIGEMFWGAYFGMLDDKFGISWMVNCDAKS
jgi:PhnB protein